MMPIVPKVGDIYKLARCTKYSRNGRIVQVTGIKPLTGDIFDEVIIKYIDGEPPRGAHNNESIYIDRLDPCATSYKDLI